MEADDRDHAVVATAGAAFRLFEKKGRQGHPVR